MADRLVRALKGLSLAQRFMLATLLIMLAGMFGISNWVGQQIESGVIQQSGDTTALQLDSFITPQLQDYSQSGQLDAQHAQALGGLLSGTPLGKWVVAFTVRDLTGRVLYTSDPAMQSLPAPTQVEL